MKRRSAWRDGGLDVRGRWQGLTGNRVPRTMSSSEVDVAGERP